MRNVVTLNSINIKSAFCSFYNEHFVQLQIFDSKEALEILGENNFFPCRELVCEKYNIHNKLIIDFALDMLSLFRLVNNSFLYLPIRVCKKIRVLLDSLFKYYILLSENDIQVYLCDFSKKMGKIYSNLKCYLEKLGYNQNLTIMEALINKTWHYTGVEAQINLLLYYKKKILKRSVYEVDIKNLDERLMNMLYIYGLMLQRQLGNFENIYSSLHEILFKHNIKVIDPVYKHNKPIDLDLLILCYKKGVKLRMSAILKEKWSVLEYDYKTNTNIDHTYSEPQYTIKFNKELLALSLDLDQMFVRLEDRQYYNYFKIVTCKASEIDSCYTTDLFVEC